MVDGGLEVAPPTRRNLALLLLRRDELQGLCKMQAMLESQGQPATHLLSGCLVRVLFKKQFRLRFVLATFVVDGQLYMKLKDVPVGVRPADCSNQNTLATPEAFLSSGQAELAELQSLLAPGDPCLQLQRVAATAWAIKVALRWAGQLDSYLAHYGLGVLQRDLRDPARISEMAGHLERYPGASLAAVAAGTAVMAGEQQQQQQQQQHTAEEGAAQGLLGTLPLQRLEQQQPAMPSAADVAAEARRHSLQQAAGSSGELPMPSAPRGGQAEQAQEPSPPQPPEQQQPQLPPLPAERPIPQPSSGGKVSFCLGKNPRLFAKVPGKQGRAGSEGPVLHRPSETAKQQEQQGKPASGISEQELELARQAVAAAQQQVVGIGGTSSIAEQTAAPAAGAGAECTWHVAYAAAADAGGWYGAPALEYQLPSYVAHGNGVGGLAPAAAWQGAAGAMYPAAAAAAGYEDELPAPRSDVRMRPSNIRPSQATARLCGYLGHCRWGSACHYAHSDAESNRFARWQAELLAVGVNPSLAHPSLMYVSAQLLDDAQTKQPPTYQQLLGRENADADWAAVALPEEEVRYFLADLKGLLLSRDPPIRVGRLRAEVPSLARAFAKLGPLGWISIQSFSRALQAQGQLAELGLVLREGTKDGTVFDYMEEEGQAELKAGSVPSPAAAVAAAAAAGLEPAHLFAGKSCGTAAAGSQGAAGSPVMAGRQSSSGRHDEQGKAGREDGGCSHGDSGKSSQGVAKHSTAAGLGPGGEHRGRRGRSRSRSRSRSRPHEKEKKARRRSRSKGGSRGRSHERSRAKRSRSRGRASPVGHRHRSPAGRRQRSSSRGRTQQSRGRSQRSRSRDRGPRSRDCGQRSNSRGRTQRSRGRGQRSNSRGRTQRSRSRGRGQRSKDRG